MRCLSSAGTELSTWCVIYHLTPHHSPLKEVLCIIIPSLQMRKVRSLRATQVAYGWARIEPRQADSGVAPPQCNSKAVSPVGEERGLHSSVNSRSQCHALQVTELVFWYAF